MKEIHSDSSIRPLVRSLLVGIIAALCLYFIGTSSGSLALQLSIQVSGESSAELFYSDKDESFDAAHRLPVALDSDGQWHEYLINLPFGTDTAAVRLDPSANARAIAVRSVSLVGSWQTTHVPVARLYSGVVQINDADLDLRADSLLLQPRGPDPYVAFDLKEIVPAPLVHGGNWLSIGFAVGGVWLLGEFLLAWLGARLGQSIRVTALREVLQRLVSNVDRVLGDDELLRITPAIAGVAVIVSAMAVAYIAANLNQSSIGVWDSYYHDRFIPVEDNVLGIPKAIRSDEWNTITPWILGQANSGMHVSSPSVGGKDAPMVASVPVRHITSLAQGKFYGFFFLEPSRAYSWMWAYRTLGLFFALFLLLSILTRGNTFATLVGTLWIYFSSFTQWWLSNVLADVLIGFALATIGALYLANGSRLRSIVAGGVLLTYAACNLLLNIYPPFILPLVYLGVSIVIGFTVAKNGRLLTMWPQRTLVALGVGFLCGAFYLSFWGEAASTINAMLNTVYPGRRVAESGGVSFVRAFDGLFEFFRFSENNYPFSPSNASEASNYPILLPIFLLVVPFGFLLRKPHALLLTLFLYWVGVLCWVVVPLPEILQRPLQLAGWAWSPPYRAIVGLGVGSIIFLTVFFAKIEQSADRLREVSARNMGLVLGFFLVMGYGYHLRSMDPQFFTWGVLLAGGAATLGVLYGILHRHRGSLLAGVFLFSLPGAVVNPIMVGTGSLTAQPIFIEASDNSNDSAVWAGFGDFRFSQGLKAQGLTVLTGSTMVPNRAVIAVLDPDGRYEGIWNRYAHVVFENQPGMIGAEFELVAPDVYKVSLDVCGSMFARLNITHVIASSDSFAAKPRCLVPLAREAGVTIFEKPALAR